LAVLVGGVVTVLLSGCGAGAAPTPSATATTPAAGTNVRVAARFTIVQSGALSPPAVTVPAQIPLELAVVSKDGRAHGVRLGIPGAKRLTVPANTLAEQLLPALPPGTYAVSIDGRPRATLRVRAG
jgi:hypothetical protein